MNRLSTLQVAKDAKPRSQTAKSGPRTSNPKMADFEGFKPDLKPISLVLSLKDPPEVSSKVTPSILHFSEGLYQKIVRMGVRIDTTNGVPRQVCRGL